MRNIETIRVNGMDRGIDFDAHYTVRGYTGIAFYLLGWLARVVPSICYGLDPETGEEIEMEDYSEPELVADHDQVVAIMVGDDRRHVVDVADLKLLGEESFCRSCGQVGCGCVVYS